MTLRRSIGFALAAALALAAAGCPLMHDPYPPSDNHCTTTSDCLANEACNDAGVCEMQAHSDGGADAQ